MVGVIDWLKTYALAIACVVAAAGLASTGVQSLRLANAKTDLAKEQKARSDDRATAEAGARLANDNYRAEEARRAKERQEALDAKEAQLVSLRADIALRDAAAGRLQERVAALVAAAREAARNPEAPRPSPAADDATGVLADVLGRCVARVRLLASVADERGAAGATCERVYDSLSEVP
jgi:hypothetical protein